jgi:hypothetical protein
VVALAIANAVLGMALGLFVSAFATTEFQVVQFMPVFKHGTSPSGSLPEGCQNSDSALNRGFDTLHGEAEVPRLLNDPGSCRVRRAASEVNAPSFELDEEEHVEATQRDGLDGEEVAGEHARGLPAQEQPPAQRSAPGRGLKPSRASRRLTVLGERR